MLETPPPPPSAPTAPVGLTLENLTVPKEKTYFGFVLLASIFICLAIVVSVIGIFYAVLFGLLIWLGNGLLAAHLRSGAVRVGPDQLPELDAAFCEVCARLGVNMPPRLYVLQSGGLLNAFAMRFAGRNFVVVHSEFLEALGANSPEMKFVLGHEIGHIKSGHNLKHVFLGPGMLFPLIGPAYRRACETSCDRFGAFAAGDVDAAVRAMLVLSGGREHGARLNPNAFAGQHNEERGFFVSLHELTSAYPTLSHRATDLIALKEGVAVQHPPRSPLAYFFALFMPGGTAAQGGAGAMMMMVVVIGMMAAMAIPAFQKVRQSSEAKMCINNQRMLAAALEQYQLEHAGGVKGWDDVVGPGKTIAAMPKCPRGGEYNATYSENNGFQVTCSNPAHSAEALAASLGQR